MDSLYSLLSRIPLPPFDFLPTLNTRGTTPRVALHNFTCRNRILELVPLSDQYVDDRLQHFQRELDRTDSDGSHIHPDFLPLVDLTTRCDQWPTIQVHNEDQMKNGVVAAYWTVIQWVLGATDLFHAGVQLVADGYLKCRCDCGVALTMLGSWLLGVEFKTPATLREQDLEPCLSFITQHRSTMLRSSSDGTRYRLETTDGSYKLPIQVNIGRAILQSAGRMLDIKEAMAADSSVRVDPNAPREVFIYNGELGIILKRLAPDLTKENRIRFGISRAVDFRQGSSGLQCGFYRIGRWAHYQVARYDQAMSPTTIRLYQVHRLYHPEKSASSV